jgi:hypothetical protein
MYSITGTYMAIKSSKIIFIRSGQKLIPKLGKQFKKLVVGKSW